MNILIFAGPLFLIISGGFFSGFLEEHRDDSQGFAPEGRSAGDFSQIDFKTGAFSQEDLKIGEPNYLQLEYFKDWAKQHEIHLEGTDKNRIYLSKNGFVPQRDRVELENISGILIAAQAFYQIPDNVLEVMKGKTIYFSTQVGRSKAIFSAWGQDAVNRGIILEQGIRPLNVIHELGHIVDVHGIQGKFNDKNNVFSALKEKRQDIFSSKTGYGKDSQGRIIGYISAYSSEGDLENFAEHFAYYVVYPDFFRERLSQDRLLVEEYEFLRDNIFNGKEF